MYSIGLLALCLGEDRKGHRQWEDMFFVHGQALYRPPESLATCRKETA